MTIELGKIHSTMVIAEASFVAYTVYVDIHLPRSLTDGGSGLETGHPEEDGERRA